jgi:hypothetical protein
VDDDDDTSDLDTPTSGPSTEIHFTSFDQAYTPSNTAEILTTELCNRSFLHQLTLKSPQTKDQDSGIPDTFTNEATSRYDSERFYGIVVDTGASTYSTAGYGQFQAL